MTKTKGVKYMAIDQYGNTYHGLKHPRTELSKLVGAPGPACLQMLYTTKINGTSVHVGYEYKGRQYRLYEVIPYEDEVQIDDLGHNARKVG